MNGSEGSGSFAAPEAHIAWLAHPAQASALPASSDSVPCEGYEHLFWVLVRGYAQGSVLVHLQALIKD